ncbi:AraC family transcriptional regulator [Dictyobacter aurantiacus]|uniref:Transcriptional regulator n=1 Tax=Dictyobacter aurantiacus TaxID=1936993 RepID=A0A401ZAN3_9CHLR|nr:AraC family transcriptional regulator [Dictyobacter aurantiacus]GCE03927.1 transcriptional regulator [Dictyobacter aurantiacus]
MDERSVQWGGSLAQVVERFAKQDGMHETAIPALRIVRMSQISGPIHTVYEPTLCIVAQGSKVVTLGQESYRYDVTNYLVASVQLPVIGQVVEASSETPYLCLYLRFDMDQILDVLQASDQPVKPGSESGRGLVISRMNETLYDAALRLVRLLDAPQDIPVLAPYAVREIIYRVLHNEQGDVIKQFALRGSHAHRIGKVMKRLRHDFALPLHIEELAAEAQMSASSLYYYFKEVTGMSPIQYQKQFRLREARRLLLSAQLEAADAAFQVGYESPSHFSREYARMFGLPPIRDIQRLRDGLHARETVF